MSGRHVSRPFVVVTCKRLIPTHRFILLARRAPSRSVCLYGRNAGYPAPPYSPGRAVFPHPVLRLYSLPAVQSQAFRQSFLWLSPAGRLASGVPVPQCPAEVACAGYVLPSRPSPCSGLSPPLSTSVRRHPLRMRWAFPLTVLLHLPGRVPQRCAGSSIGPCPGFPFRASGAVCHTPWFSTAGTAGAPPSSSAPLFLHATA